MSSMVLGHSTLKVPNTKCEWTFKGIPLSELEFVRFTTVLGIWLVRIIIVFRFVIEYSSLMILAPS
jgi:hypothetical protein